MLLAVDDQKNKSTIKRRGRRKLKNNERQVQREEVTEARNKTLEGAKD